MASHIFLSLSLPLSHSFSDGPNLIAFFFFFAESGLQACINQRAIIRSLLQTLHRSARTLKFQLQKITYDRFSLEYLQEC